MVLVVRVSALRMARNIAGRALLKNSMDIEQRQGEVSKYIYTLKTNPNQCLQQFHIHM